MKSNPRKVTKKKNAQNARKRLVLPTPKSAEIDSKKALFLQALRANGGHVSDALRASGLNRRTAYNHFSGDPEFADDWLAVLEVLSDELYKEARRRALGWEEGPGGRRPYGRAKDRMLIFLLKRADQKRWNNRLEVTANIALETITKEGKKLGLTSTQISQLCNALVKRYYGVPTF